MPEKLSEDSSDKDNFLECKESLMREEEIIENVKFTHGH